MNIIPLGETAIVLQVSYAKTADAVKACWNLRDRIEGWSAEEIRSVRCGLDSVLVEFEAGVNPSDWNEKLAGLPDSPESPLSTSRGELRVPVCFEPPFAPDLEHVSERTGLTPAQMIDRICETSFQVWMIGFMPGFPYMGELPVELQIERKRTPALSVPSGSVAIADEFIGIYPFSSPGGWHIIGRTPWKITDYSNPRPWIFETGMNVRFEVVRSEM